MDSSLEMESDAERKSKRRLPRNVWVVTLTSFLTDVSSEMVLNLLPLFLFNVLGVRTSVVGLIEGIAEATASLTKGFSGWISDVVGTRKPLAVLGYAISTLAKPFLYIATTWGWVLGVRFADRLGKGVRTSPRDALLADSVHEDQRGLAFGLHRAGDTAGAFLGLAIAVVVLLLTQKGAPTLERSTFQIVVVLSLIPAVLAVIVLAVGAREIPVSPKDSEPPRLSMAGFDRRFKWLLLVIVVFSLGNSSDAFLILRAQDAGLSVAQVMGMLITFNLIYALVSGPAGALSDRIGRKRVLSAGWLFYGLVYVGFAFAREGWQIWTIMSAYGLYYALTEGVAKAYIADLVAQDKRGTAYGIFNAAVGLSAFPASLLAGLLWQGVGAWAGFGPSAPFLFGALLAMGAVILLGLSPKQTERNHIS
jgi:MFS family permease